MRSASAPVLPVLVREVRALVSRWHPWAAVAALGAVQAALVRSAAPLDGTRPLLVHGVAAAWLCALPVVVACAAADDRASANLALLLQLGHGTARITFAKVLAAVVGALVVALPVVGTAVLLATRDAVPALSGVSLVILALGALQMVTLALFIAAVIGDTGWAAAATMLGALAVLWLDVDGRALDVVAGARSSTLPLRNAAVLVVGTGVMATLAAIWASPTASGERRTVRTLVTLAIGGALGAAASRVTGTLTSPLAVDVRARAAEATAIGELQTATVALAVVLVGAGLALAWWRR